MTAYSGTPLAKKLGFKEGHQLLLINPPAHYFDLFEDFPKTAEVDDVPGQKRYDVVHFFTTQKSELLLQLPQLRSLIKENGTIWVSWPKGSSKIPKDLNENDVRNCMLGIDLVDVKVCAVDGDWSGLKGMIRVEKRKG